MARPIRQGPDSTRPDSTRPDSTRPDSTRRRPLGIELISCPRNGCVLALQCQVRFMARSPVTVPAADDDLLEELVIGNRIIFDQGVVDAFGHLSVRHDKDPAKYLMSRHLAPGLVTA